MKQSTGKVKENLKHVNIRTYSVIFNMQPAAILLPIIYKILLRIFIKLLCCSKHIHNYAATVL